VAVLAGYHPSQHSHVPGITGTPSGQSVSEGVKFASVVSMYQPPHRLRLPSGEKCIDSKKKISCLPRVYVVISGHVHVKLNSKDSGSKVKRGTYEECN